MIATMTRITGNLAIDYAEARGALVQKYADPIEGARDDLTVAEARAVAAEDPSLLYVDVAPVPSRAAVYTDGRGDAHVAVEVDWSDVTAALGHEHGGYEDDDAALVALLLASGAPEWVSTAEGYTDETCWGLIGPAIEEEE